MFSSLYRLYRPLIESRIRSSYVVLLDTVLLDLLDFTISVVLSFSLL
jgi:hypothetical protein